MITDVAELFDGVAAAQGADRRLSRRVIEVWARAARGRFPSWADFRRVDLGEDWNWMFVVDLKQSVGFPYFIFLGQKLARLSDVFLSGSTDWTMSLLDQATSEIDAAVAIEGPHLCESVLTLCDGRALSFRLLTAPLADDGEAITHVLGAANGRLVEAGAPFIRAV